MPPRFLRHVPNMLTSVRLVLGLGFPLFPASSWIWIAAAAALTEALDGPLSRRWDAQTTLGTWLDPIADKVFVFSALVTLAWNGFLTPLELFFVIVRDLTVVGGVIWSTARRDFSGLRLMRPIRSGKFATALQLTLLLALFVLQRRLPELVWVTAVVSVFAGVSYVHAHLRKLSAAASTAPSTMD